MNPDLVKANLNLYAVLKNLEDLTEFDSDMRTLIADWNVSIQFLVRRGPAAYVSFKDGSCEVGRGKTRRPSIKLWFTSPAHLNRMFDGKSNPIPLKGFTRLGFLAKEFPKLTGRLEWYLKPTDELMKDRKYLELNTRMTLNTAAYAVPEIAAFDSDGQKIAKKIPDGTIVMKILPGFHNVNITFSGTKGVANKGDAAAPMAMMSMKNVVLANAFLNGKTDAFTAIASGDVSIRGIIPMLDAMSLLLDRVQHYLS